MADFTLPDGMRVIHAAGSQSPDQWYIGVQCWPVARPTYDLWIPFHRHGDPDAPIDAVPCNYVRGTYSARGVTQLLFSLWDDKGFVIEPIIVQGNKDNERVPGHICPRVMSGVNVRIQSNGVGDFELQLIGFHV